MRDLAGHHVLLAGRHGLDAGALQAHFRHTRVVDAVVAGSGETPNWVEGGDGRPVVARAFCPDRSAAAAPFPFAREEPRNDVLVERRALAAALGLSPDESAAFAGEVRG